MASTEAPAGHIVAQPSAWPLEALLFTQIPVAEALRLQEEAFGALTRAGARANANSSEAAAPPRHQLLITEHPPTCLVGEGFDAQAAAARERLQALGVELTLAPAQRAPGYIGPGQLAVYLTVNLEPWHGDVDAFVTAVEEIALRTLADFGIAGARQPDGRAVRVAGQGGGAAGPIVATLNTRLRRGIAMTCFTLHTNTDTQARDTALEAAQAIDVQSIPEIATMTELGMPVERQDEVREAVLRHAEAVLGLTLSIPQRDELRTSKPPWLKARLPFGRGTEGVRDIIEGQRLHTVCESAHCPNQGECWRHGTATFMINGNVCTRSCSFCAIYTGRPQPIDCDEPRRLGEAAAAMGLKYVVVTSVNRDELPDGGASQFAKVIAELRARIEGVHIEVLIPDFRGVASAQDAVFAAAPDVLNHNIETVPRLYKRVRPQARYQRSLDLIRRAHEAGLTTKSGFMLGLGEQEEEIAQTLADLRAHDCNIVTIGQYLRPSEKHHPVIRYATPLEFDRWRRHGESLGFKTVESGPMVRSSYHAHLSYRRHTDGNR